jgi:hypothetical protein
MARRLRVDCGDVVYHVRNRRVGRLTLFEKVDRPQTDGELAALRRSAVRGAPYGDPAWRERVAVRLKLGVLAARSLASAKGTERA